MKQATISESVTYGDCRVGFASRRGIMGRAGSGLLGGFGVAFAGGADCSGWADWLGLADGAASGTATRIDWFTPSRSIQTSVEG